MIWLVLGCTDPIVRTVDTIEVPRVDQAEVPVANVRIGVTGSDVFLDPGPLDLAPLRVLGLADPQDHELALPALVAALEPVRDALPEGQRFVPELVIGADVPYRAVVRVIYSVGMAMGDGAWIAVTTPSGPGRVELLMPAYCGADPSTTERCVSSQVRVVDGGIDLTLDEILGDRPGCTVVMRSDPTPAGDWRGKRVVRAQGICPTLQGHDPRALSALLERTTPLGEPCGTATLSASDGTPWGEVVPLWLAVRARHSSTFLAIGQGEEPACGDGYTL